MKKIIFLIAIFLMINGCEENSNQVVVDQTGVLMPLAIGNTWIYKYTLLDSNNKVEYDGIDTLTVLNDSIINGNTFFGCSNGRFYRNSSWGLEMYFEFYNAKHFNSTTNYYKFPTNQNDNWILLSFDDDDISVGNLDSIRLKFTTLSISKEISTPKGKFNTIMYKHEIVDINNNSLQPSDESLIEPIEQYISPNIGIIKSIYLIRPNDYKQKFIFELIDYKLN